MKRIIFHFTLGIFGLLILVYASLRVLDKMTLHGESILVPDMRSYSIYEVEDTLSSLELRFSIVDSGAYNPDYPRGSVIEQLPKPFSRVKRGRELYLTVNPKNVSLVSLPDYTDRSLRQYMSELKANGFRIGAFLYQNDEHANVVLGVQHLDSIVEVGQKLEKSTKLDLVLGNGLGRQIDVPDFIGKRNKNMIPSLQNFSLNAGEFHFDETVVDTLSAFVYLQEPEAGGDKVDLGAFVNLWFTEDSSNLFVDTLALIRKDSLKARLDSILNE